MKYALQVFTGSRNASGCRAGEIIRKIGAFAAKAEVGRVIIGWSRDTSVYREVASFLHRSGIQMLLWLPVFSEIPESLHPDHAEDVFGNRVALSGVQEEEGFRFVCPSSGHNARIVEGIWEKHFSDCGFDGVFLDRVRGYTFTAGVSGMLSCACGRCRNAFLAKGVDPVQVRALYESLECAFFDMASWPADGEFIPEHPVVRRFFETREEIISGAVHEIVLYFKRLGLTVGLDLFAPVISRLAGQNRRLIAEGADFIKPMLYRRTEAPAGIGFELALFEKNAPGARGLVRPAMDVPFLHTQFEALENVPCEVCPGFEINYDQKLVRTDAGYIRESLAAARDYGFGSAALCWNVMQAPEVHMEAAVFP